MGKFYGMQIVYHHNCFKPKRGKVGSLQARLLVPIKEAMENTGELNITGHPFHWFALLFIFFLLWPWSTLFALLGVLSTLCPVKPFLGVTFSRKSPPQLLAQPGSGP